MEADTKAAQERGEIMKLIDADKLIEQIKENREPYGDSYALSNNDFMNMVKEQETASPWIPISEKLPPLGSCIIVTIKDGFRNRRELRYPVWYIEHSYSEGYGFYHGDDLLTPEYSPVLAWMPIPNVYEGKER